MPDILDVPFEIQAMLVSGYLAYRISVVGIDREIKGQDQFFQILVFGFLAWYLGQIRRPESLAVFVAIMLFIAIFLAIIWRANGREFTSWIMKKMGIHTASPYSNVILELVHGHSKLHWRYISVVLKNGKVYKSDCAKLDTVPSAPDKLFIDEYGNVGLYVTDTWSEEDGEKTVLFIDNGTFELTYIPAIEIQSIDIGWRKK